MLRGCWGLMPKQRPGPHCNGCDHHSVGPLADGDYCKASGEECREPARLIPLPTVAEAAGLLKAMALYREVWVEELRWGAAVYGYDHPTADGLAGVRDMMERLWPALKAFALMVDEAELQREAVNAGYPGGD